jgi:hypothetical protein
VAILYDVDEPEHAMILPYQHQGVQEPREFFSIVSGQIKPAYWFRYGGLYLIASLIGVNVIVFIGTICSALLAI